MSPKTTEQFGEIRRRSSQSIKDVALELFARKGFHNTSISEIAREAGVSKGLMYNYYDSKEALLQAIIQDAMETGERLMKEHLREAVEPADQLRGLTEATFNFIRINSQYLKLLTALAFQPGVLQGMEDPMQRKQIESVDKVIDLFRQMKRENPEQEALFYGAALDGILLQYLQMGDRFPLEEMKNYLLKRFNIL